MPYAVKEMYFTLQGEGVQTGRPAVFLRFAGCNLWDGLETHRETAVCRFCDTDFVGIEGPGGGRFTTPVDVADRVRTIWNRSQRGGDGQDAVRPFVVCTGGEPLLQLDDALVTELHGRGFEVAVETNGTMVPPAGIDWLCVSPKAGADLVVLHGDELKLVYPQARAEPEDYAGLRFRYFSLQPMDGPFRDENTDKAVAYCLQNPQWRLSLQTHKILGIP